MQIKEIRQIWFIADLERAGVAEPIIPFKKKQKAAKTNRYGEEKSRNHVERIGDRLKSYRRIATIFDKLSRSYKGFIFLAAANLKFIMQTVLRGM